MEEKCEFCNGNGWYIVRSRDSEGNRVDEDVDCNACEEENDEWGEW